MNKTTYSFFTPYISNVDEELYHKTDMLIDAAKAIERNTYQRVYIYDYYKQNFLYASGNIKDLLKDDAEKLKRFEYDFFAEYMLEEEKEMRKEIAKSAFDFFYSLPLTERKDYTISYNIHLKLRNGVRLVNLKLTPLVLNNEGRLWLVLCTESLAAGNEPGNVFARKTGDSIYYYVYSLKTHKWEKKQKVSLSNSEREVLYYSTQGLTMDEIADRMCRAIDTVKTYKRAIFQKMGVKNISEAIAYAQNHQLI